MAGIQIVGNTNNGTAAEVELNTKALRTVVRPNDYTSFGMFSIAAASSTMAAGLAASAPIFAFRNSSLNTALVVVKKVVISAGNSATAFAAGVGSFSMFASRSWTTADTGGTDITPTSTSSNQNKLRTSMGGSGIAGTGNIRISATGTLTAGVRTLDSQPMASVSGSIVATAGTVLMPNTVLFQASAGDFPLVCATQEGFVIQATVPATGTWTFSVQTVWEELGAY